MINNQKIEETVSNIIKAAESIVDRMEGGSRLTTKQFASSLVEETGVPVGIATGLTALIVKNCDDVEHRVGRSGGIFKIKQAAAANEKEQDEEEEEDDDV